MSTRNLSLAALAVTVMMAVMLSLAVQPLPQVTASYRADPGCWDLVENGGFEATSDWTISSTVFPAAYSTSAAHSGDRSMRLGIPSTDYDRWAWSSVYQDVTIPFDAESAWLSFWYKPYSFDTSGWDIQGMILYDTYWNPLETVLDVRSNSGTWTEVKDLDVSAYAGQTVRLYFYVSNNEYYPYSGQTWMYVDDVSLEWCSEGEPEPDVTPTVQVGFDPDEKSVYPHTGPFEMGVVITDVADLGAFEFDIVYDPDVLLVEDVQLEDFLGRTGRIASTAKDDTLKLDGRYSFGAWTQPPAEDPDRPGPTGSGVLATTFLSPVDDGETGLDLENVHLFDTAGDEIPIDPSDLIHGHVIVEECVGDVNHDGVVDILDVQTVAAHWGCELDDECYDDDYDFNDNDKIDVGDVMVVVDHAGECEVEEESAVLQGAQAAERVSSWVRIEPRESSAELGESLTVSVVIEYVEDLGGFEFHLSYEPALLQVTEVTLGDLLGSTGRTPDSRVIELDNDSGVLKFMAWSLGDAPGPDEDGVLAEISLTAEWFGQTSLRFEEVKVADTQGAGGPVAHAQGGQVTVEGGSYVYLPLIAKQ